MTPMAKNDWGEFQMALDDYPGDNIFFDGIDRRNCIFPQLVRWPHQKP